MTNNTSIKSESEKIDWNIETIEYVFDTWSKY